MKRLISFLLVTIICCSMLLSAAQGADADPDYMYKLNSYLLEQMEGKADDAIIPISVRLVSPSSEKIEEMIPISRPDVYSTVTLEEINAYLSARRTVVEEVFSGITGAFVQNYLDENDTVRYRGRYTSTVICNVPKSKVFSLAALEEVTQIVWAPKATVYPTWIRDDSEAAKKLTAELKEHMETLSDDEPVTICVDLKMPSEEIMERIVSVPKPGEDASQEEIDAYNAAYQETWKQQVSLRTDSFVNHTLNGSDPVPVYFIGKDVASVICEVAGWRIADLASRQEIDQIDLAGVNDEPAPCEHDYQAVVTAPTCTKAGYTTYTCAKCGDKYTDDEVPALDHDFKDGVCTRCGAWDDLPSLISVDLQEQMKIMGDDARVMVAIDLKGLDQDFVLSEIAKESGLDENTVKKVLNGEAALADSMAYIDAQRAVLKRLYTKYNNDFLAAYLPDLPADCRYYVADTHATIWASLKKEEIMNIAWKDQVFSMGYVSYAYDPLIPGDMESPNQPCEHDYNAVVKVPTCTESGYTIYTCTKCNDKYISDEIAALEHSWDEGEVTKEPSETENGERTFTCSRCGEKKTESILVKEHVHNYIEVKTAPTCTEDGYSVFTCACGRSYKGDEVPALGHDFKDGVCTRCEAKDPDYEEPVIEPFRFDDVKDSKQFYFAPVYWAVDQKITRGTSEKLFSPDEGCRRAGAHQGGEPLPGCQGNRLLLQGRPVGCGEGYHQGHKRRQVQPGRHLHSRPDRDLPLPCRGNPGDRQKEQALP